MSSIASRRPKPYGTRGEEPGKWYATDFPGVEYQRLAPKRGAVGFDVSFRVRFMVAGRPMKRTVGRLSTQWTAERAARERDRLLSLAWEGQTPAEEKKAAGETLRLKQIEAVTFADAFERAMEKADKKERTKQIERGHYREWLHEAIGGKPLKDVSPLDLERVKKEMQEAPPRSMKKTPARKKKGDPAVKVGRSPRTIELVLGLVRWTYRQARIAGLFAGDPPTTAVKVPREDNKKERFLNRADAARLLDALREHSEDVADAALLALHCGLRQGEILGLERQDVDLDGAKLHIRHTKARRNRWAYLTEDAVEVVSRRLLSAGREPAALLFAGQRGDAKGRRLASISKTFDRIVAELGLNDGVSDRLKRLTFHGLRHTAASWWLDAGVPLHVIRDLLGHSTIRLTERYAHTNDPARRDAARLMQEYQKPTNILPLRRRA